MFHRHIQNNWTPIFEVKRSFFFNRKTYERVQFPLQPSAAKTVHKSQGAILESVVVSLSQTKQRKIPHIHSVALSRVKSLNQLYILDFNDKSLSKDKDVDDEIDRLSKNELKLCFKPVFTINATLKLLFNNARSLNKHFLDIKSDQNILAADIVGIAESRICAKDLDNNFALDGFKIVRNDAQSPHSRPHHGIVLYLKDTLLVDKCQSFTTEDVEFSFVSVRFTSKIVQCIVLYKKPSCALSVLYATLENKVLPLLDTNHTIVIMGDFNIDLNKSQKSFLNFMLTTFGCRQVIQESTTKLKSQLDLIFSNSTNIQTDVLEAYWSNHNMIYCGL